MEVVGGKQGGTSLQGAHHNLTWQLYFPNKIGVMWEVGGSGEAHVSSIGDVDGYNHIVQYVYHCTLLQLLVNLLPRFLRNFNPSDIEITWFRKWNSWSTKTRDANSKHVLHLCADTSSPLGSFFCTPNQWLFLVVWWNQFIQTGSYSQTFLIWFPLRVLKCAGSGWGRWGRSGWGVWLVGSPRKHRGKAVGSNGNSMKQCCVAKRSYKELINFLSCFPRIGPTACAGPSWQSNLDSTHCPHEAPRPRETIERPEKKHWWSWWLDGQNLGSWEFLVRP